MSLPGAIPSPIRLGGAVLCGRSPRHHPVRGILLVGRGCNPAFRARAEPVPGGGGGSSDRRVAITPAPGTGASALGSAHLSISTITLNLIVRRCALPRFFCTPCAGRQKVTAGGGARQNGKTVRPATFIPFAALRMQLAWLAHPHDGSRSPGGPPSGRWPPVTTALVSPARGLLSRRQGKRPGETAKARAVKRDRSGRRSLRDLASGPRRASHGPIPEPSSRLTA